MDLPCAIPNSELLAFLEQELANAEDWWMIQSGIYAYTQRTGDVQSQLLEGAFNPGLTHEVNIGPKSDSMYFGKKEAFIGVEEEVSIFYEALASACKYAPVRARIRHVLFSARHGNVGSHIRNLATDYLEVGNGDWLRINRLKALEWSLHFARISGDKNLIDQSVSALITIIEESFNQDEAEPGVTLHALEALALHDSSMLESSPLLIKARSVYSDSYNTAHTIGIQKKIAKGDTSAILSLNRDHIQSLIDEGNTREPLVRHKFMENAAQVAHKYGIWDLYEAATKELQSVDIESLGLVKISGTVTIEGAQLTQIRVAADLYVQNIMDEPTLLDALKKLVGDLPPSGDVVKNELSAQAIAAEFPLQNLISTTHLRSDGLPNYTSSTPEDLKDESLSKMEVLNMLSPFDVTGRALQSILDKFQPNLEELTSALTLDPIVSNSTARSIAKSLLAFQRGDYEESATMVMPKIETLARNRLAALGELAYQVQIGDRRATLQQMGTMISDLQQHLPPSWHRFLHTFLVGKFGPNYRNDLLHGYIDAVEMREASHTLLCALFLAITN